MGAPFTPTNTSLFATKQDRACASTLSLGSVAIVLGTPGRNSMSSSDLPRSPGQTLGGTCSLAAFITRPQHKRGCRLRRAGHMALIATSLMLSLLNVWAF